MHYIVTVPKTIKWVDWLAELEDANARNLLVNYRIPHRVDPVLGSRCYIVWNGRIRGWLSIVGCKKREAFVCESTGRQWPEGWYLIRVPPFYPWAGPRMRGFQGIRLYRFYSSDEERLNESSSEEKQLA